MVRTSDHDNTKDALHENPVFNRVQASAPSHIHDNTRLKGKPSSSSSTALPASAKLTAPQSGARKKGMQVQPKDPHNLIERFIEPQSIVYQNALLEIQQGEKRSCWLWFVLPTAPYIVNGVERGSSMNRRFALRNDEQAKAYLLAETKMGVNLRQNYIRMLQEIERQLKTGRTTLDQLLGPMDSVKAISSFRLFERIGKQLDDEEVYTICGKVLALIERGEKRNSDQKSEIFSN